MDARRTRIQRTPNRNPASSGWTRGGRETVKGQRGLPPHSPITRPPPCPRTFQRGSSRLGKTPRPSPTSVICLPPRPPAPSSQLPVTRLHIARRATDAAPICVPQRGTGSGTRCPRCRTRGLPPTGRMRRHRRGRLRGTRASSAWGPRRAIRSPTVGNGNGNGCWGEIGGKTDGRTEATCGRREQEGAAPVARLRVPMGRQAARAMASTPTRAAVLGARPR